MVEGVVEEVEGGQGGRREESSEERRVKIIFSITHITFSRGGEREGG